MEEMKRKFACVLRLGGDYSPQHVLNLKRQVDRFLPSVEEFICYTDAIIPDNTIITRPFISDYMGRWSMQEVVRETGHVLVTGLDTLFLRNCDWLFDIPIAEDEFYGMCPINKTRTWANGIMLWKGDWSWLFTDYLGKQKPPEHTLEQLWTYRKIVNADKKALHLEDHGLQLKSFKRDCRGMKRAPKNTDIIIFHGKPRPHEVNIQWVKELYNA